jgi:hypothetical protein
LCPDAWRTPAKPTSEYAFYLPVPEKSQVQHNYILFPKGSCLSPLKTGGTVKEPLVFTVPSTAPPQGSFGGSKADAASAVSDSYQTLFHWALKTHLKGAGSAVSIVAADPNKFHSVQRQPHRPNEKAVHVKAFRGSKDGYLFFLENGILWGYKKPLMFIPLHRIAAISYTNVLRTTFNIVVEVFTGEGDATDEVEFGMLDQEDYAGISETYVKRHGLQDRSMADTRKAKMELAENMKGAGKKAKGDGAEGPDETAANGEEDTGPTKGMSELEKARWEAEQLLQDEEDEEEDDYDPGSDADSDGSGSSSDGEDDEEQEGEGADGEGEEDGEEEGEGDEEGQGVEAAEDYEEEQAEETGEAYEDEEEDDAGVPYTGAHEPDMDLDEQFDVVG